MGGRDTFYPLCPCKGKIQRPERALPQNRCLRKILVLVKSTNGGGSLWTKTYDGPGQPCKAGWEPPALGRWYCQAPTGWLHPRTSRAPAGSQSQPLLSPHYFTTLVESRRPSPLLLRGRVQPSPQPSQAPAHEQHIRQKCKKRKDNLPSLSARKYGVPKVQTRYFSSSLCTFLYACQENQIFGNLKFNHKP